MFTHDAEYFRRRRRAQGIPARDPFFAPTFQQRAIELQRLEQLPWPRNLFGEPASIAELMAESAHAGENADVACSCGYRNEHKRNVSQTLRNPYGRGFDVIYFRSEACKNTWNQELRRRQVGDLLARPGPADARGVHSQHPCASPLSNATCPSSGGSLEKWVCTTSECERTLIGVDCALHHEIAAQLAEIANSEGG